MRIGLLAEQNPEYDYSDRRLQEAIIQRGHELVLVDPHKVLAVANSGYLKLYDNEGFLLPSMDAAIPRITQGIDLLRQLEFLGVYMLNPSYGISLGWDKFASFERLSSKGFPLPKTAFARGGIDLQRYIDAIGDPPTVIKLTKGTFGIGVILAESKAAVKSTMETLKKLGADFLVQEFVQEAKGRDLRCFVIGDEVVGSMQRTASSDYEFRANVSLGASVKKIEITAEEYQLAVESTKALKLNVSGVDILRSERGPLVLEVNTSPQFEGLEKATGLDIADKIVEFLERKHKDE